eukprot:8403530-Pyramimonas_sp.AAC.1
MAVPAGGTDIDARPLQAQGGVFHQTWAPEIPSSGRSPWHFIHCLPHLIMPMCCCICGASLYAP